jgi:hypothetical protein
MPGEYQQFGRCPAGMYQAGAEFFADDVLSYF